MLNIILLGITSLLTDISTEMVYPLLPIYLVTTLGASPAILGFIEGVAESLSSLLKVFSGYWSDKIRARKPFTILGYAGSTLGKLILFLSTSWMHVLGGRVVDRIGKGIRTAPRDALIADATQAGKRGAAFGLHRTMDTFGAMLGVIFAYLILVQYKDNLKNVFLLSLIPAAVGVFFLFFVREKKNSADQVKEGRKLEFKWANLDGKLKFFLIFTFIFTLGNSSNQFLLLKAKDLGNPLGKVILFYLVYNISYVLFAYPAARLSDKVGRKKLLVLGYLFYGLVYLGFAMNKNPNGFWVLFGIYGLYMAFTEGVEKALVSDIAPQNLRTTTIGLHAMLVGIGLLPASLIAGILWKYMGAAAPFYFGGFMGIFASIGLWFILKGI